MSILVKNAVIITPQGTVNGCLLTNGNRIEYIGTDEPATQADETVDAAGGIVLPGFVNAHTHASMTYFRSFGSDLPLKEWLDKVLAVEDNLDDEIIYYGSALAAIEAMESGTTCINDMYFLCSQAVRAYNESGIRAYVSRNIVDIDGNLEGRFREQVELENTCNGLSDRIHIIPSLHAEYTCSEKAVRRIYEHAAQINAPVHMHISETTREVEQCRARHNGMSPLVWMESLGVLNVPTIAAHCVAVDDADIDVMLKRNVTVAHNPISNLKLASGICPVPHLLERGVNVAIGTDGCGSNNNLDMFREMFTASILHKGNQQDASVIPAATALKMATENGAKALGINAGILQVGSLADFTVLKPSPFLQPMHDAVGIAVYSGEARDVSCTVVNGKITVKQGQCVSMDKKEIVNGFNRCIGRLFK